MSDEFDVPGQLTSFIGRAQELHALENLMAASRLVTVVGPGGCGKTRLAAEVAAHRRDRGRGGRPRWVDLTGTTDPTMVWRLIAEAAGVLAADRDATITAAAQRFAEDDQLVVLDNCEHVLDGVAEVAELLLRTGRDICVVATSREPLGVSGEQHWRVPPMAEADAVALFGARALLAGPVEEEADLVRTACARLDGIPLAVELAAAWSGTLSLGEILAGIDDRFALLVRGPRGLAARHQTLLASMDWSHDLLEAAERVLFRRLGVFQGAFSLSAAQAVCGYGELDARGVLDGMRRLVEKSLVVADTRSSPAEYRMLETVREYALARLRTSEEYDAVRTRHLEASLCLLRDLEPLLGEDLDAWREEIVRDELNLRVAVEYGLSRADSALGRELAAELPFYWHLGRRGAEGLAILQRAVDAGKGERSALQARLLVGLALVADTNSPLGLEYDAAQEALEIAREVDDRHTACLALLLSAVGCFYTDFDAGLQLAEMARSEAEEIGHLYVRDGALALAGIVAHLRDEHASALALLDQAVAGLASRSERGIASTALGFMALSELYTGRLAEARHWATEAVETARPLSDYHRVGSACAVLATVEVTAGRPEAAWRVLNPVLSMVAEAADPPFVPGLARAVGNLHRWEGRPREATGWYAREGAPSDAGTYLAPQASVAMASALRASGELDGAEAACRRALSTARGLGMPRVTADALDQLAFLAHATDPAKAESWHHEALGLRVQHDLWPDCLHSLEALARTACRAGSFIEAARALGACEAARARMGYPPPSEDMDLRRRLVEELGVVPFEEALGRGQELDLPAAVEYVRRARGSRGRPSTGWTSLTPTEWQVVRLAAEGLTNPQIGDRLFMSRGTVKTHLSHSYAKLAVQNRTELAAALASARLQAGGSEIDDEPV